MRILLINNYLYPRGGAERSFFRLSELLEAQGHEVIHFACRHPQNVPSPYERLFPTYHELREVSGPLASLRALADMIYNRTAARNLSHLLRQVRPDVAHLNNIYHHLSSSILPVLARHNVSTVLHVRDGKFLCPAIYMFRQGHYCDLCQHHRFWPVLLHRCGQESLVRSMCLACEAVVGELLGFYRRHVDSYICPSRFLRGQMISRGFRASKSTMLPNFIHTSPATQPLPANRPDRFIFCASRLELDKGMFILLEAARLLPEIPLLIAGDGPAYSDMSAFLARHQLPNVQLLGWQDEPSLAELFRSATASIVPSLLPENCPNVILESAAQSCPVIASDVGGIGEFVQDGANGWIIRPGRAEDLAQAMGQAFADPQRSDRLGASARQRVVQHHSPDAFYQSLMGIYQRALERHA